MAQQIGYLLWTILMPIFFLLIIGGIQLLLTRDASRARQTIFSGWAIALALGLWILALFARFVENFP